MNDFKIIENLRKISGTLPSENPDLRQQFLNIEDSIEVTLEDHNFNPYKTMFVTSTSTWGDNEYKRKWPITSNEGKLEVIKAVLTNNTLPQAREMVNFVFRVKGVPRWLFDHHTLNAAFTSFMSIGCRDNNKKDSDFVFESGKHISEEEKSVLTSLKELYSDVISKGSGSWQSARTFLPQNYSHSYHFGQNLLSIASMKLNSNEIKSEMFKNFYYIVVEQIHKKFPLIGLYLFNQLKLKNIDKDYFYNLSYDMLDEKDKFYFEQITSDDHN